MPERPGHMDYGDRQLYFEQNILSGSLSAQTYPILSFRRYIILFFGSMAKGYILDRKYIVQSLFDCNLYRGSSEG